MTQPLYTPAEKTPAPMPQAESFAKELALSHGFKVQFDGETYPDPAAVWMIEEAIITLTNQSEAHYGGR